MGASGRLSAVALAAVLAAAGMGGAHAGDSADARTGAVALARTGSTLQVLVDRCAVRPTLVVLLGRPASGGYTRIARWRLEPLDLAEGVTDLADPGSGLPPQDATLPLALPDVVVTVRATHGSQELAAPTVDPARLAALGPEEVLVDDGHGGAVAVDRERFLAAHCATPPVG